MLVWGYASGFPKSKASLKPAWEPIVMARKPGPLRMLAIDECRIGTTKDVPFGKPSEVRPGAREEWRMSTPDEDSDGRNPNLGRWPANIVLGDAIFEPGVEGVVSSRPNSTRAGEPSADRRYGERGVGFEPLPGERRDVDGTGYSRFFLIPKAARADREPVLGGLPQQDDDRDGSFGLDAARPHTKPDYVYERKPRANVHPTVKPTDLMRHLVRLVTPTGGVVLDPFGGSGTTAIACELEGFPWILIEREAEYVAIAEARLNGTQRGLGLDVG
jgi:DNA modification methylase